MSGTLERLGAYDPLAAGAGAGALRYLVLDVFTTTPLEGNPLAVVLDARALEPALMGRLARELNLSETVFLLPPEDGGDARARIFTPSRELPFAGHPVLGTATVLGAALGLDAVTLETGSGPVRLARDPSNGDAERWRMRQPLPTWRPFERTPELLQVLGVARSQLPVEIYTNGPSHLFVAVADELELARLAPDPAALAALGEMGVSCFCASGSSWHARVFAPALGVAEDPATGSAAGPLAVHLARHGAIAFGEEIEIHQGARMGRPSLLLARAEGSDTALERVEVAGSAVLVAGGTLAVAGV